MIPTAGPVRDPGAHLSHSEAQGLLLVTIMPSGGLLLVTIMPCGDLHPGTRLLEVRVVVITIGVVLLHWMSCGALGLRLV